MGFLYWRDLKMLLNELDGLRLEMIKAKKKFDSSFNDYALNNCGHNIGDAIEVNGFSHRGKKMIITSVSAKYDNWSGEYFAVLHGSVLKNDGTKSKNQAKSIF